MISITIRDYDVIILKQRISKKELLACFFFADVKDVVHPVLFLLSDKADMINGVTLVVDGGKSVA